MKIRSLAATLTGCVFLLLLAVFLNACTSRPAPDPGKRDAVVASVMQALNVQDKEQLVKLAQPGPQTADSNAQLMLSQWGGVKDSGYTTAYSSDSPPDIAGVRVSTKDRSGNPVDVQFSLRWNDNSWLLNLGPDFRG